MMSIKRIALGASLLVVIGLLISCGVRTETAVYSYSPSWTRGGQVIFIGSTSTSNKDILGAQMSSSYAEYVKTIYASGTGESSLLWDATNNPPYEMTVSPVADYVAYGNDLRSGLYKTLVIRNISSGTHSGVEVTQISFPNGIIAFDWSNDGTKLVYCTATEIRTIKSDGTGDTLVVTDAGLTGVTWKYGTLIAFTRTVGSDNLLSVIDSNGANRIDLTAAASVRLPQISAANTNEVFGLNGTTLAKVDVTAGTPALTTIKASFTGALPRLSPDATMVTYSKTSENSGIYALDVATATESKIK
jgi:hypothetical protein